MEWLFDILHSEIKFGRYVTHWTLDPKFIQSYLQAQDQECSPAIPAQRDLCGSVARRYSLPTTDSQLECGGQNRVSQDVVDDRTVIPLLDNTRESDCQLEVFEMPQANVDGILERSSEQEKSSSVFCLECQ